MSLIRINRNPSGRQLLAFGLAWLALLGLLGWRSWLRGMHPAAEAAWALAAAVPLAGLFRPRLLRWVYLALSYATYPIGFAASRVVLALVYYLALTPIGLTMRLFGHDPLFRRFDPSARSYWVARGGAKSAESYLQQY
jgi:Saxitoxin biosynthesis operon protein SxtJ